MRIVSNDYNAITGESSIDSYYLSNATVVTLPITGGNTLNGDNKFKEDLSKGKIRFFYVAAKNLNFKPEAGDKIFFEGDCYDIAGATPLEPAGVHLYSTVGCRIGDKNHLGTTLAALVDATEIDELAPTITSDANIIEEIITRIEDLEQNNPENILISNKW
ncbi:hypothetical protein OAB00_01225 [Akkermansiaceae bacterium]|nr:hypothetical protein [Akkermansiaceae bacterium]